MVPILLIGGQLSAMSYLLLTGPVWPPLAFARAGVIAGLCLGVWAVWAMRVQHLRIHPAPHEGAVLCERGPYRRIRHPMYTAVLLVFLSLSAAHAPVDRLAAAGLLVVSLLLKMQIEERMLERKFAAYASYKQKTGALLPAFKSRNS